eukprot:3823488-Amphidinium_carterae.1
MFVEFSKLLVGMLVDSETGNAPQNRRGNVTSALRRAQKSCFGPIAGTSAKCFPLPSSVQDMLRKRLCVRLL